MKWTKRMLSVVLALLMIVGLIPLSALPVFAGTGGGWDDAVELELDAFAYAENSVQQGEMDYAYFIFIPEEDGRYIIESRHEEGADSRVLVYAGSEGDPIATDDDSGDDENFRCMVDMTAGIPYRFRVEMDWCAWSLCEIPILLTRINDTTTMVLNRSYDVDIYEEYVSEWFSFTAQTAGYYAFYSYNDDEDSDPKATLYNNKMEEIKTSDDYESSNFRIAHLMEAGDTVYLEAYMYSDCIGTYSVKAEKLPAPTGMYIEQGNTYTTYVGESVYFNAVFTPEDAYHEAVDMTSDNETVLRWSEEGEYFYAVAPGTATVTATSESGLTDTIVVTVKEVPVLALDVPHEETIPFMSHTRYFDFSPSTTGNYAFMVTALNGDMRGMGWLLVPYDDDMFEGGANNNDNPNEWIIQAELKAGCTYRLRLIRYEDETDVDEAATEFSVVVQDVPAATGIAISYDGETTDTISGYPNDVFCLSHKMVPFNALWEGVTYTSSNEDVVTVAGGELYLMQEGTAVITATSENGLTDTITVTVQDYPSIALGETVHLEIPHEESRTIKFVPTVSGYYNFTSSNNTGDPFGVLFDADMNGVLENDDGAGSYNFKIQAYLNANMPYYLEVRGYSGNTITCDVTVTKPPKATKIAFVQGTAVSAYQGGVEYFELAYTPADAVREKITWKSSNTSVVKIIRQDDDGVQVWYKGAGKATLTATTANTRLKASVTITVTGAVTASLNTVKTGTITKTRRNYSFKYTPSVTGDYVIYTGGYNNGHMAMWESTSDGPQGGGEVGGHVTIRLTAKKTYYFSFSFYENVTGEFTFMLYKAKNATAIALDETTITVTKGEGYRLPEVTATPVMAITGAIAWLVEDEDVAYVEDDWIYGNSAGTTTLTAITPHGLTASATVTVKENEYASYFVGEEVTEPTAGSNTRWYTFSPSASGYYLVSSYGASDVDPKVTLYNSDMEEIAASDDEVGNHFKTSAYLQADETYYARIYIYGYSEGVDSFTWSIRPAIAPTGVQFREGDTYTGYVGSGKWLEVDFLPANAGTEGYTFAADSDAVSVDDGGYVEFVKPGTATVTVTTDSGLTASIEITVIDIPAMAEGMSYPLGFSGKEMLMKFVPAETGVYSFYTDVSSDLAGASILNAEEYYVDAQWYSGENSSLAQCKLTAGETYYLRLYQYDDVPLGATIRVVKTTKKGVPTLDVKSTTKIQGRTEGLFMSGMDPTVDYGVVLGWTTSDPKLAIIYNVGNSGWIRYIRAGKVTITAQCTYGDAKATVTINAATAMTQGKEYVAKVVDGKHTQFKFAPTKDGYYTFYLYGNNGQNGLGIEIRDPQGNYLDYDGESMTTVCAYLVAGQTYYPIVDFRSGGPDIVPTTSYKIKVGSGKAPAAAKGIFEMESDGEDAFVPTGELAVVRIKARGEGLTYKWYYANKGKYTYAASSITKDTYSVKMDSTRDGRKLFCVVTDKYGNKMTSDIITIGIKKPLKITTQLTNAVAKNGGTIKASFAASGDGLTYTWYYKDAGADEFAVTTSFKSTSYTTTMTTARAGRQVFCVVSDKYGHSVKTATVTLYMGNPIKITAQPKSTTVKNGATAKATVKASGDGLTYTWYIKNKGAKSYTKSSITKSTYSVKMSTKVNGRQVYCVVKDKYGKSVKSSTVTLKKK